MQPARMTCFSHQITLLVFPVEQLASFSTNATINNMQLTLKLELIQTDHARPGVQE